MKTTILICLLAVSAWGDEGTRRNPDYWIVKAGCERQVGCFQHPVGYERIPDRWTFEVEQVETECPDYADIPHMSCTALHYRPDTTWTPKQPVYLSGEDIAKLSEFLSVIEFTDTVEVDCRALWIKAPLYIQPDSISYWSCGACISVRWNSGTGNADAVRIEGPRIPLFRTTPTKGDQ